MGAVDGELAFDAGARLLAEVEVPEVGLAVEVGEVEGGTDVLEEGVGLEANGVATEAEVEVGLTGDFEVAGHGTYGPELCTHAVVEGVALCLGDLATDGDVMFLVVVEDVEGVGGQG